MNSKCGVQSKRGCKSHESCVCIVGFAAICNVVKTCVTYRVREGTVFNVKMCIPHLERKQHVMLTCVFHILRGNSM